MVVNRLGCLAIGLNAGAERIRARGRRLRDRGSLRAVLTTEDASDDELVERARSLPPMAGQNLAAKAAGQATDDWTAGSPVPRKYRIVAIDCGIKYNILRSLARLGCEIIAISGRSPPEVIIEQQPQGILVGNGPGDPAVVSESIKAIRALIGKVPIFGICLGHQLIACALGADIYKLKFGHHGTNHPVRNLATGRIEITSQNHGFAVAQDSLPRVGAFATHVNLNDHSLEGFAHNTHPLMAVQYHPESAPGPHDSAYLFELFTRMIETGKVPSELTPN